MSLQRHWNTHTIAGDVGLIAWVASLTYLALASACSAGSTSLPAPPPESIPGPLWSTGETLRVDLDHSGSKTEEHFSVAVLRREGVWPGDDAQTSDSLALGDYQVALSDPSGRSLYARGVGLEFDDESAVWTSSYESVRVPFPRSSVELSIRKRINGQFVRLWGTTIVPTGIEPTLAIRSTKTITLMENGPPRKRADLIIVGDGYTSDQSAKFEGDAHRATQYLFDVSPYRELRHLFNVRAVFVPSDTSGVTSPLDGQYRRTFLDVSSNHRNVERSLTVRNLRALRDVAAIVPYEFIIVLANSRRYGGRALFNGYSVVAIDSKWAPYLVPHEFAHQFGGLGDEYFTLASCDSSPKYEPWEPNITANLEGRSLKWAALMKKTTPIPTLWNKSEYESFDGLFARNYFALREARAAEDRVDALIDDILPKATRMLDAEPFAHEVGAFEGAANQACGMYRPQTNCTMFTLIHDRFCTVCAAALTRAAEFYAQ